EPKIDYNRDILPILAGTCFTCHGPADTKAGLRLDLRAHAIRPVRSGNVPIKPGQASASEVVRRIFAADESQRMPPPKSKKVLTPVEKERLKKWIDQGAEYADHWAFIKPVRPMPPQVKDRAWL